MTKIAFKICPYQIKFGWFFDYKPLDLVQEGLTDGVPEVITNSLQLVNQTPPCSIWFSDSPIFNYSLSLIGPMRNGHQYFWQQQNKFCWFCPALLKFYKSAPEKIWFIVKGKNIVKLL